jgi:hypothetical protein
VNPNVVSVTMKRQVERMIVVLGVARVALDLTSKIGATATHLLPHPLAGLQPSLTGKTMPGRPAAVTLRP